MLSHMWYAVSVTTPLYAKRFKNVWHGGAYVTPNNKMMNEENAKRVKVLSLVQGIHV